MDEWKYRKIVKKFGEMPISVQRIREMQRYFGFEKLKYLNNFLDKLPENSLYEKIYIFS